MKENNLEHTYYNLKFNVYIGIYFIILLQQSMTSYHSTIMLGYDLQFELQLITPPSLSHNIINIHTSINSYHIIRSSNSPSTSLHYTQFVAQCKFWFCSVLRVERQILWIQQIVHRLYVRLSDGSVASGNFVGQGQQSLPISIVEKRIKSVEPVG